MLRPLAPTSLAVKKKIIIKPLSKPPELPAELEKQHWQDATEAAKIVLFRQGTIFSNEAVCRSVETLVGLKQDVKLYQFVVETLRQRATEAVSSLHAAQQEGDASMAAKRFARFWEEYLLSTTHLMHLFVHLDRRYVLNQTQDESIVALGIRVLAEILESNPEVFKTVLQGYLLLIDEERRENLIDRTALATVKDAALSLKKYVVEWEPAIVTATEKFYSAEGARLLCQANISANAFFRTCHQRLLQEKDRVRLYMDKRTRSSIETAVHQCLIKQYAEQALGEGKLETMLEHFEDHPDDVRLTYYLLRRRAVSLNDFFRSKFKLYLTNAGQAIVNNKTADDSLIASLLQLHKKTQKLVATCFDNDSDYNVSLREAFESILKTRQNRVIELLAKNIDSQLRDTERQGSESEIEASLSASLALFNMAPTKDVFEAFYAKDFAKRLIYQKTTSVDLERFVISELRKISGSSLGKKLEGMLQDMDQSKDLQQLYAESRRLDAERQERLGTEGEPPKPAGGCEMTVTVLTAGYWPTYPKIEATLPQSLETLKQLYTRFYNGKYNGRVLQWQHNLSTASVTAMFPKGKKELSCSFTQALILLLFNRSPSLAVAAIKEGTNLDEMEITTAMLSLSVGSVKILKRESGSTKPKMEPQEMFHFNADFVFKQLRIKVPQVQLREAEESAETTTKVIQERQYVIDAVLVRTMKTRKKLSHNELVAEVTRQLRFPVQPIDIKKSIEVQIEREYLQRSQADPSMYEYLA